MATIKPAYILLKELSEDSLELIDNYLSSIDVTEFSIKELTLLAPVLIDVYEMSYSTLPKDEQDPLNLRVNMNAMALISECIGELETAKDHPELTRKPNYVSTIRALNKLHSTANKLGKLTNETRLEVDFTLDDMAVIGIQD